MNAVAVNTTRQFDEFEFALLSEISELRKTEQALVQMYPRLKNKPQLRPQFLQRLADMQMRAHRLDAILNPVGVLQVAAALPDGVRSSVA